MSNQRAAREASIRPISGHIPQLATETTGRISYVRVCRARGSQLRLLGNATKTSRLPHTAGVLAGLKTPLVAGRIMLTPGGTPLPFIVSPKDTNLLFPNPTGFVGI